MQVWSQNANRFCSRVRYAALATAKEYQVDPFNLLLTVIWQWQNEREQLAEVIEARRAARKATRLTIDRIGAFEDAGKDYTAVAGLDVLARELAGMYPALGIPHSEAEDAYDGIDHAALLWELLRKPDPIIRSQHDESLVREAAEMMVA